MALAVYFIVCAVFGGCVATVWEKAGGWTAFAVWLVGNLMVITYAVAT